MEERAFEYIDALAANLGVAAEHVYGALLKQAMVSGVRSLVFIVICLAVVYVVLRLLNRIITDVKEGNNDSIFVDGWGISPAGIIASFAGGIAMFILFIVILADISNATTALLNPEYWALKEILGMIKGADY